LGVRADRSWRFVRGNDLLHAADCNCKFKPHNECRVASKISKCCSHGAVRRLAHFGSG
jgi:hypothetical protein